MISVAIVVALVGALAIGVVLSMRRPAEAGRMLRRAAPVLTVLVAALLTPYAVADSGAAAAYLLGVPVAGALVPVVAERARVAWQPVADAVGAVVITVWALLLALGIGMVFLPSALLLFAALPTSMSTRGRRA